MGPRMRKTLIISCLIAAALLVTSGAPAVTGEEEVAPPEQSEDESQKIAAAYILSSPTFTRDGKEDTLQLLATTALEQPFSWQFEYEFQCGNPGYGRLTGEPTPIAITSHRAEIVVREGKVISAVLDDKWDMLQQRMIGEDSTPAPPLKGNWVRVDFNQNFQHEVWGDSFVNAEVTGRPLWRISHTENIKDETGEPVRGLKITLDSDQAFDWVGGWGALTKKLGPPTYEWFYGDLGEDYTGHPKDVHVGFRAREYPTKFSPGFDVSRSFDKTVFTAPDTQTVTVTVTPREETFERVLISVGTEADTDLVDAVIISQTAECDSRIDPSGHYIEFGIPAWGIPVELNTPLTVTATIRVTPKVPVVEYKPHVQVHAHYPHRSWNSGTVEGSSFSYTNEAGTWTVSAEGNYFWDWRAPLTFGISVDLMASSIELSRESQEPTPALGPTSAGGQAIYWQVVIGIVAGIVIIGLAIYFFIRGRRRRVA